jgi:hypothetical protein
VIAAAIDVGCFFHRFASFTAVFIGCDARAHGVFAFLSFASHSLLLSFYFVSRTKPKLSDRAFAPDEVRTDQSQAEMIGMIWIKPIVT